MNSWYLATSILLAACLSLLLGCGRPSSNNDDNDDDSEADDGQLVADDDSGDDLIDDVISNDDAGFYSTDGWCWQNPWPQGNAMSAVWVASTCGRQRRTDHRTRYNSAFRRLLLVGSRVGGSKTIHRLGNIRHRRVPFENGWRHHAL